jgi:alpha-glucosidase
MHAEDEIIVFERHHDGEAPLLVALNLGSRPQRLALSGDAAKARLLLSTELDRDGEMIGTVLALRPAEGVICEFPLLG